MKLILPLKKGSSSVWLHGEMHERHLMHTDWAWNLNTDYDDSVWRGKGDTVYFWNMF